MMLGDHIGRVLDECDCGDQNLPAVISIARSIEARRASCLSTGVGTLETLRVGTP